MKGLKCFCLFVCVLVLSMGSQGVLAKTRLPAADRAGIKTAYYKWLDTVQKAKGDPTAVLALYASGAILLPTLANQLHFHEVETKPADIRDYFVKFTGLSDLHATTQKLVTRDYFDTGVAVGLYTFSYTDTDGQTVIVPARFDFVYQHQNDGRWLIVLQHSSQLPKIES